MADDDTDALEQVATAVERSQLTDHDVQILLGLLDKLDAELKVYREIGDLFSLGGTGYKRAIRAPGGVVSVRRYLDWRERQREELAEPPADDLEGTRFEAGFGRLSDREGAFLDCPLCGEDVFNTRVGKHLFSAHWEEIVQLAEHRDDP
jgi:hypothetical protein